VWRGSVYAEAGPEARTGSGKLVSRDAHRLRDLSQPAGERARNNIRSEQVRDRRVTGIPTAIACRRTGYGGSRLSVNVGTPRAAPREAASPASVARPPASSPEAQASAYAWSLLIRQFLWQWSVEALTIIPGPEPPPRGASARLPLFRAALRVTQAARMARTDGGMRRWRPMPSLGHTCQHDERTSRLITTPALRRREI
jgi:hypothetical protein